jgi:hypothetical protein
MWTNDNRARYDRSKLRYPSDLTDEDWPLISSLITPAKRWGYKRTGRYNVARLIAQHGPEAGLPDLLAFLTRTFYRQQAPGGGAPKGNRNTWKHGNYSA